LLDKTPLAERREQPMHARLGEAEGAGDRGHSTGLGRPVEVKEDVEGFLDRSGLFHYSEHYSFYWNDLTPEKPACARARPAENACAPRESEVG